MAEIRQYLQTRTDISISEQVATITVAYDGNEAAAIVRAFIADFNAQQDGVSYKEGELIISIVGKGSLTATINAKGELILTGVDVERYSINDMGHLIYTY